MTTQREIVRLLSDGGFQSGTDIGDSLNISRAAVCKAVKALTVAGLQIHSVPGRGYRLAEPLTLLDGESISRQLGDNLSQPLTIEVLQDTDSTSAYLLRALRAGQDIAGRVCLAEAQNAGRGRRGRKWVATPYSNVMLSFGWKFEQGPGSLAGLSLAAGVAVAESLQGLGVERIGLKWPNDIISDGRKLGGLLIDLQGEAAGPTFAVLGVGLNIWLGDKGAAAIDQPWIDLSRILGASPDRNRVAAGLVKHLADMFSIFAVHGFAHFRAPWQALDVFSGRPVRVMQGETSREGIARGVDHNGGLQVEDGEVVRVFHAGEVTLRGL